MSAWTTAVAALSPRRWYRLGEASGSTVTDAGSDGLNGTVTTTGNAMTYGTSGLITGDADTAITIAAGLTQAEHPSLPDTAIFDGTNHWTIVVWVSGHTADATYRRILEYRANPGSGNNGVFVWSQNSGGLAVERSVAGTTNVASRSAINTATHMVAVTYDAATVRIYLDAGTPGTIADTRSMAAIATTIEVGTEASAYSPFGGVIDEFLIFDTDLTATQVGDLYAAGTSSGPASLTATAGDALATLTEANARTGVFGRYETRP
jgi:Concanavalin A-like lectin/glucanases superfamily